MSRKLFNYDQCRTKKMEKNSSSRKSFPTEIALKMTQISAGICRFCDRNRTRKRGIFASVFSKLDAFLRDFYLESYWHAKNQSIPREILLSPPGDAKTLKSLSQHVKLHSRIHNLRRNSSVPIQNPLHLTRKRRISASEIRNLGFYLESHQNPRNQIIRSRISLSLSAFRDAETLTGNIRSGSWKIREKSSDLSIFGELESNQKEIWDKNVQKIEIPSRFRQKRAGKMGLLPVAGKYREKGTSFLCLLLQRKLIYRVGAVRRHAILTWQVTKFPKCNLPALETWLSVGPTGTHREQKEERDWQSVEENYDLVSRSFASNWYFEINCEDENRLFTYNHQCLDWISKNAKVTVALPAGHRQFYEGVKIKSLREARTFVNLFKQT